MPLTFVNRLSPPYWPGFNFHIVSSFELFIHWNVMQCGLDCQINGTMASICKQIGRKSTTGKPEWAIRKWIEYLITRDVSSDWAWLFLITSTVSKISTVFYQRIFAPGHSQVHFKVNPRKTNFLSHWVQVRSLLAWHNDICHRLEHASRSRPYNWEKEPAQIHIWNNWQLENQI